MGDENKKSQNRVKKEQIVAELVEKLNKSNGLVFADFQGLTHIQLESLKKELKTLDSTIVIAKNSLIKLSLGQSEKFADFKDNEGLELPTATLFIQGDMVEPLKKLQKAVKDFGLPKIKFGILEGNLTDEAGVMKIASLPSKQALLGQFVGLLNFPIQGLVVTLNGNIQKLAVVLNAIAQTKPAVSAPASAESTAEPTQTTPSEQPSETTEQAPAEATPATDEGSMPSPEAANKTNEQENVSEETGSNEEVKN